MNPELVKPILASRSAGLRFPGRTMPRAIAFSLFLFALLLRAWAQDPNLNPNYPMDTNASLGGTISLRVIVTTANYPLTCQWQHEGTNLPGATAFTLVLANVAMTNAGAYSAIVSNSIGDFATSRVATVSVDPTFTKITRGLPATDAEPSGTVTWIDYDQDGRVDLFVGNIIGSGNSSVCNSLYHNEGGGSFSKVTTNLLGSTLGNAWGVAWGDYDNDGNPDLCVANWGASSKPFVFHNEGHGAFTRVTTGPLVQTSVDGTVPLWGDYDNDGFIDLFLAAGYWGGPQNDRLYHNEGNGQFKMMTSAEVGDLVNDRSTDFAIGWLDFDNDGVLELFVQYSSTTDTRATNCLFRPKPDGTFEKTAIPVFDTVWASYAVSWGDYDNDGYPDAFFPSLAGTNALFRNLQGGGFEDVADKAGLRLAMNSNASAWGDYDNDGWLDLFVGNYNASGQSPRGHALFHNNHDGTFTRILTNSLAHEGGAACAAGWGDYDNDGFLDLYVANGDNLAQQNLFYHNNGNSNHWVEIKLRGTACNRLGIGAKVRVRANIGGQDVWQMRTITGQHSWVGDNGLVAHFGLGDATTIDWLRVEWPSGNVYEGPLLSIDQVVTLNEPVLITPARPSASLNGAVTLTRLNVAGASYQWQFQGTNLLDQTNRLLTLRNLLASQQGRYSVVVSNATTLVTNFVFLIVDKQFTKVTTGPVVEDKVSAAGMVFADYDNDNYPDLLVLNDPGNGSRTQNSLYHNQGDGTFLKVEGTAFAAEQGAYAAGAWADINNDGGLDCYVADGIRWYSSANTANHLLYLGGPGGALTELGGGPAAPSVQMAWGTTWGDFDNDGLVDIFLVGAMTSYNTRNYLFHNKGDLTFERVSKGRIVTDAADSEFAGACDYDGDGDLDILVSSHFERMLYQNNGNGTFTRITSGPIPSDSGNSAGLAWGDYDNDGRMDLCLATFDERLHLFHNDGGGNFTRSLLGPSSNYQIPTWADYDNDGWLDLFVTHGYGSGVLRNRLYHNNGDGTFTEVLTGSLANEGGFSLPAAWADYDNNGFLDLVVGNGYQPLTNNFLYRNNGNSNNWLMVKLVGTTSNRSAIGAKIRPRATIFGKTFWQMREINGGTSRCQNDLRAHFGLGNAQVVPTLRVEWPSGTVQLLSNVAANQTLTIVEPRRPVLAISSVGAPVVGTVRGDPNQTYRIDVSDDLTLGWSALTNTTTDATGKGTWSDPGPAPQGRRFYKASGM